MCRTWKLCGGPGASHPSSRTHHRSNAEGATNPQRSDCSGVGLRRQVQTGEGPTRACWGFKFIWDFQLQDVANVLLLAYFRCGRGRVMKNVLRTLRSPPSETTQRESESSANPSVLTVGDVGHVERPRCVDTEPVTSAEACGPHSENSHFSRGGGDSREQPESPRNRTTNVNASRNPGVCDTDSLPESLERSLETVSHALLGGAGYASEPDLHTRSDEESGNLSTSAFSDREDIRASSALQSVHSAQALTHHDTIKNPSQRGSASPSGSETSRAFSECSSIFGCRPPGGEGAGRGASVATVPQRCRIGAQAEAKTTTTQVNEERSSIFPQRKKILGRGISLKTSNW